MKARRHEEVYPATGQPMGPGPTVLEPPVVVPGGPEDFPALYQPPAGYGDDNPIGTSDEADPGDVLITGYPDYAGPPVPGAVYPTPAPPYSGTPQRPPGQPRRNYRPGGSVGRRALESAFPLTAIGGELLAGGSALLTGEELTRVLLDQTFRGGQGVVQTELEQLLERPRLTDLERLLQQPMSNPGAIVEETAAAGAEAGAGRGLLGLLGPIAEAIGLLFYPTEAGISAGEEAQRVIAGLQPPTPPAVSGSDTRLPEPVGPLTGLLPFTFPDVLEQVTVTAPAVSAPAVVPAPFVLAAGMPDLGLNPLLTTATLVQPKPRPATLTQPAPSGRPATPDLTGYDYARFTGPLTNTRPSPRTQTQPQSEKCSCKKPTKEKKKKKPRDVCYRGTYTEGPTTLHKRRKEKIPCQ